MNNKSIKSHWNLCKLDVFFFWNLFIDYLHINDLQKAYNLAFVRFEKNLKFKNYTRVLSWVNWIQYIRVNA